MFARVAAPARIKARAFCVAAMGNGFLSLVGCMNRPRNFRRNDRSGAISRPTHVHGVLDRYFVVRNPAVSSPFSLYDSEVSALSG